MLDSCALLPYAEYMMNIIDTHLHIYSQDKETYPRIEVKTPPPPEPARFEDYKEPADTNSITRSVLVQPAVYGTDASYIHNICTEHPNRFVGVVIADYTAETVYWTTA